MLLELTEQELNIIVKSVSAQRELDEQLWFNDKQKKEALCVTVLSKLEAARIEPKDEIIKYSDFEHMISTAKQNYARLDAEIFLSNKKLPENYFTYLCFLEALTSWLNNKGLLKRLARFDFTDKRW